VTPPFRFWERKKMPAKNGYLRRRKRKKEKKKKKEKRKERKKKEKEKKPKSKNVSVAWPEDHRILLEYQRK
jgi:hypothetical protein